MRELLARIDSRELAEWFAYNQGDPIGAIRGDLQAGIVASTVANCHRAKNAKPFEPGDFMPLVEKAPQSVEDMQRILMRGAKGD